MARTDRKIPWWPGLHRSRARAGRPVGAGHQLRPGQATLFALSRSQARWRLLGSRMRMLRTMARCRHARAAFQAPAAERDVRQCLTAYANAGGPHHNALCFGDARPRTCALRPGCWGPITSRSDSCFWESTWELPTSRRWSSAAMAESWPTARRGRPRAYDRRRGRTGYRADLVRHVPGDGAGHADAPRGRRSHRGIQPGRGPATARRHRPAPGAGCQLARRLRGRSTSN